LAGADWVSNAVTANPASELDPLFARHGLPQPRIALRTQSVLTSLVAVATSDLLELVPAEFATSMLGAPLLERIPVTEEIAGTPIVMIQRTGLPLTPAAEYFADMIRRASIQHVRARRSRRASRNARRVASTKDQGTPRSARAAQR